MPKYGFSTPLPGIASLLWGALMLLSLNQLEAQNQDEFRNANFRSANQNMWGPGNALFQLEIDQELFRLDWDEDASVGGVSTILGQQFGARLNASTWGDISSRFVLDSLTTGDVTVAYPIQVHYNIPNNGNIDKGSYVDINTSYEVEPGWELSTNHPFPGRMALDFYFGLGIDVNMLLCVFSCVNIPIIPNINIPIQKLNIFTLSPSQAQMLGPVIPFTNDLCTSGFCVPGTVIFGQPSISVPDNPFGISGNLIMPYTPTEDRLGADKCLYAEGDSIYITLSLDILGLVGNFLPPPAGPIIGNLSNDFKLPPPFGNIYGASIWYNVFSANFNVNNNHIQEFAFKPVIETAIDFPLPMDFRVVDPNTGAVLMDKKNANNAQFRVGNTLQLRFPCHYESLELSPTIKMESNNFSNNTYDQIEFDLAFAALEVGFNLPPITIVPRICFPEICINIPYPCPTWSNPFRWCSSRQCTPPFCTPAVRFGGLAFGIGPLWEETIPLGALGPITWFNEDWRLEGFRDTSVAPFRLFSRPYAAIMDSVPISCFGDSSGQLNLSILNGVPPFNLSWSDGSNTTANSQSVTQGGLTAGPQFVTVTDANGCATLASTYITQPTDALEVLDEETQSVLCAGQSNGAIDMSIAGGSAPYQYLWSTGDTTEDLSNVPAGTYNLTVIDANGCVLNRTVDVIEPQPTLQQAISTSVSCFGGSDGALAVSVNGGSQPYTYSWSNGLQTKDLQGISAGSYQLTITDVNGCVSTETYQVDQPLAALGLSAQIEEVSCQGLTDGSINIAPQGGTSPYTFQWTTASNTILASTADSIGGLEADTYQVIVTDANNCIYTDTFDILEPESISIDFQTSNVDCYGQATASIQTQIVGGSFPYTYNWSNGSSSPDLNGLEAGSYELNLTDANGCVKNKEVVITQPDTAIFIQFEIAEVSCFGAPTGGIDLTPSGGSPPYSFLWSNGDTREDLEGVSAGNYSVVISDANNCSFNQSFAIDQPAAALSVSEAIVSVSCFGGNDGSIEVQGSGGTPPYDYQWTDSLGQVFSVQASDIGGLSAGAYRFRLSDAKGCTLDQTYVIGQPDSLDVQISGTDINCLGGQDGSLEARAFGGTAPYQFSWNHGDSGPNLDGLTPGSYQVLVRDAKGCEKRGSYTLSQPGTALKAEITKKDVSCFQGNDGRADVMASGGVPPYQYEWSRGDNQKYLADAAAGTYTVVVRDANGCTAQSGTVITAPSTPLQASIEDVSPVSCFGGEDGSMRLSIEGGEKPYIFQWADTLVRLSNPEEVLEGLSAGTYQLRVIDGRNCEVEELATIDQPPLLSASIRSSQATCAEKEDGSIELEVQGGSSPYTYIWNDGSFSKDRSNLGQGIYSVLVTDANDCFVELSARVEAPDSLVIWLTADAISCREETDGSAKVHVFGGTRAYSFEWSNGEENDQIDNLAPGAYQVVVTDNNGCIAEGSIVVPGSNEPCFFIPNTFTPNGDGVNDTWNIPYASQYPDMEFQIFNQWGQPLFTGQLQNLPWDGMVNGKVLPDATYYYIMDLKNGEPPFNGPLTIVK